MPRDPRYDILFEPIQIGPVTARNRFYQVPHCTGLGYNYPKAEATMRGIKAEGGWGVVSTQEVEIHPSSDWTPYLEGRLWDEGDMKRLQLTVDAIHEHGSLAAVEITHNGHASGNNLYSRLPQLGVSEMLINNYFPAQSCAMTKRDIADLRRWHRKAALRAKEIGFDIVYVYAAHSLALAFHFISRRYNQRTDEYGGSLENRVRLVRELIEDTKDAVGDKCGIAFRFAVDELMGDQGISAENEGREVVEMLADYPDIWDICLSDWSNDSVTSRFAEEGFQEKYAAMVKQVTNKPVVGVGRFTSPDTMVSQIKRGVLDMIGAARPSIADPFLPNKIDSGQIEDIRECIGCNICVSGDNTLSPIRCTQNPTMTEEYRKGWHPENIETKSSDDSILIIGAGPSGLEAAMSLGRRGYNVTVAEAGDQAGGRVLRESQLPGLSAWKRVMDYRLGQIEKLDNVEVYLQSELSKDQVLEFSKELWAQHVVVATGAKWDRDGIGRAHRIPIPNDQSVNLLTPDDIMQRCDQIGNAVVYDDDHYYMGGVVAEALVKSGLVVTLVTPAPDVSVWTHNTLEQQRIEDRLRNLGITLIEKHQLHSVKDRQIKLEHVADSKASSPDQLNDIDHLVLVTARQPQDGLFFELEADLDTLTNAGIKSLNRIGDCMAPATIAAAVYDGHRYAREFGEEIDIDVAQFKREYIEI